MKGDVGMSVHEKERKQEDTYTKIQTPYIPVIASLATSDLGLHKGWVHSLLPPLISGFNVLFVANELLQGAT